MSKLRLTLAALLLALAASACSSSSDITGPSAPDAPANNTSKAGEDSPYMGTGTGKT